MNRSRAKPYSDATSARSAPLLFDCCRCGPGRAGVCLTFLRWNRYGRTVALRLRSWKGKP